MKRPKTVIITGATSGIGAAIAGRFAADGSRVYLIGRNAKKLAVAARELPAARLEGTSLVDLGSESAVARFLDEVRTRLRRVDVLILAAGEYAWTELGSADVHGFDSLFDVNVRAPYLLTQGLLPFLERAKGQIIVINSSVVRSPGQGVAAYKATQHAMQGLIDSLRQDLNQRGIRVSSVFPGRTNTPRMRRIYARQAKAYDPTNLLDARDVAHVVATLADLPPDVEITDIYMRPRLPY